VEKSQTKIGFSMGYIPGLGLEIGLGLEM